MRRSLNLLTMMTGMLGTGALLADNGLGGFTELTGRPFEPVMDSPEMKRLQQIELWKRQGLQPFTIDGKEVWARNEKNAIRKAKNLNYAENSH